MSSRLNLCLSVYRRLASAYPNEFRMLYGEDLDRLGEDAIPEVWRRYGVPGLARLLADIAIRLPATYLREIRQDVVYAVRTLAKSPGFTFVAVLSLGVGIGMCCAFLSEMQSMVSPPRRARSRGAGDHSQRRFLPVFRALSGPASGDSGGHGFAGTSPVRGGVHRGPERPSRAVFRTPGFARVFLHLGG